MTYATCPHFAPGGDGGIDFSSVLGPCIMLEEADCANPGLGAIFPSHLQPRVDPTAILDSTEDGQQAALAMLSNSFRRALPTTENSRTKALPIRRYPTRLNVHERPVCLEGGLPARMLKTERLVARNLRAPVVIRQAHAADVQHILSSTPSSSFPLNHVGEDVPELLGGDRHRARAAVEEWGCDAEGSFATMRGAVCAATLRRRHCDMCSRGGGSARLRVALPTDSTPLVSPPAPRHASGGSRIATMRATARASASPPALAWHGRVARALQQTVKATKRLQGRA